MGELFSTIIAFILSASLSLGISTSMEQAPADAVNEFMSGMISGDDAVTEIYLENKYVNFLENVKGDENLVKKMNEAIFKNTSYEIEDIATKGNVAVAKVKVKTNDFSKVMDKYDDASYDYVMNHLYEDKISNKKKLRKECFRIYVEQIVKTSNKKPKQEEEIFIPMSGDGYGGWEILLTDEVMEALMGNLQIPAVNTK
ncbi:MAG: DUF5105 domain-containing protein [Firmicutes bacterium]|nr:DUF5105 domain-containing protein [Bacillota bacterium]